MWNIPATLPLRIAVIQIDKLRVDNGDVAFQYLSTCAHEYQQRYQGRSPGEVDGVQAARQLFRVIGIDPTKRRPSSEALLRRALKGKALYQVNSLVDVGNWCSLDFLLPIGIYDSEKIQGEVSIRIGKEDDEYLALNRQTMNFFNRYVLADEKGAFGSPMTDSQRTAVSPDTRKATLVMYAPVDYQAALFEQQAQYFATRVIDVCGGIQASLDILGESQPLCRTMDW